MMAAGFQSKWLQALAFLHGVCSSARQHAKRTVVPLSGGRRSWLQKLHVGMELELQVPTVSQSQGKETHPKEPSHLKNNPQRQ